MKLTITILLFLIATPVMAFNVATTTNTYAEVEYYSDFLQATTTQNLESITRYNACKKTGQLYVGNTLSFDCDIYTSYDDYIEKKIIENEEFKLYMATPRKTNAELEAEIDELRTEIEDLKVKSVALGTTEKISWWSGLWNNIKGFFSQPVLANNN